MRTIKTQRDRGTEREMIHRSSQRASCQDRRLRKPDGGGEGIKKDIHTTYTLGVKFVSGIFGCICEDYRYNSEQDGYVWLCGPEIRLAPGSVIVRGSPLPISHPH